MSLGLLLTVTVFRLRGSKVWSIYQATKIKMAVFVFPSQQVATALLVAGSTLTFWIPPFVCTSSYSSIVESARLLVKF